MPTENPRITFTVSEEMKDQINEYQFNNRIKNQSQAILSLIKVGMDSIERESKSSVDTSTQSDSGKPESVVSDRALEIAKAYDKMSDYGKAIVDFIVAQEEKQKKDSFGKPKIMRAGTMEVPDIESVTGVPVGHPASAQAWYNAVQEQKELAEESKTKRDKT